MIIVKHIDVAYDDWLLFPKMNSIAKTSMTSIPQKTSRGRQKIEIKRRESIDDRRVTFTKRRTGLFEKAAELCVLCDARVVIITFSEGRKAFCFSHPDTDTLLEEYLIGCGYPSELADVYAHATNESERRFLEAKRQLDIEKLRLKLTRERHSLFSNIGCRWWEKRIEELESEELDFFKDSLEKLMNRVVVKLDEITKQELGLHQSLVGIGHDNVVAKDWFMEGSSRMWSDNLF